MSRQRIIIAVVSVMMLAALLLWQRQREQLIAACIGASGIWNGPKSRCDPDPHRITIQRNLHRS